MLKFEKGVGRLCRAISTVSMWAVFAIALVLVVDIILRNVTADKAILGTYELTETAMIIIIYLSLAVTQFEKGNIHVVMLIEKFPWRFRIFLEGVVAAFTTVLCVITFYASILQALTDFKTALTSQVLFIPRYPFDIVMAIGLAVLSIVFALDTIHYFVQGINNIKPEELKRNTEVI